MTLLGRDDGVPSNQLGKHSTGGFDTEGKRADIDEDDPLCALFTGENATLDGSAVGDGLIRVDAPGRLLAVEEFFE